MKALTIVTLVIFLSYFFTGTESIASEPTEFSTEKMMTELHEKIALSKEQWEQLKPLLDQKSEEIRKSLNDSVEKGFVEYEEMSKKFEKMSADSEKKVQDFMKSEEVSKFKEYLGKLDKEALTVAENKMINELSRALELTEDQLVKLRPVLEVSMAELSRMIAEMTKLGSRGWDSFKKQYESFNNELKKKMEETLDNQQLEKLDKYNKEQEKKIENSIFI